jgi:hypothetical protein
VITEIEGLRDGVLGFEASGKVTAEDYEKTLIPAIESAHQSHEKVRMLLVFGDDFDGYTAAAAWDDSKLGLEHPFTYERVALVTDHEAYRAGVKGFGFLLPGKFKVFGTEELADARAWVSADS